MECYSFLISIIIISKLIRANYIKLDFFKDKYISPNFTDNIFYASIYTNISLGTPQHNISVDISTDTSYLTIKGSKQVNDNCFNQSKSESFYFIKYGHSYEYKNIYFHATFFADNFILQNKSINLISMMDWGPKKISRNNGLIGLQLVDLKFNENNILLNQLYDKNIIKYKMLCFFYETEEKGELYLGNFPNNITNKLDEYKFIWANNTFVTNGIRWGTKFKEIKFGSDSYQQNNIKINDSNYLAIFSNTYYGYVGSKEYNNFVRQIFFDNKINSKECWTKNINDDKYFMYICNDFVRTSKIPSIHFYHETLNYVFEIEQNDMWINHNNMKYFIISFSYHDQYSWILGQKFLQKYPIVLDGGNNLIGLYYKEKSNIYIYIYSFLFIFVIVGSFFYFYYKYKSPKNKIKEKNVVELVYIDKDQMNKEKLSEKILGSLSSFL